MKILLHSCCAPCTIYPLENIGHGDNEVEVIFFNPNIHPFQEYKHRLNSLKTYLEQQKKTLHLPEDYDLSLYLREVVFNEKDRCSICYKIRLEYCFKFAADNGFDGFTSTLLYSNYQNHNSIKSLSESLAEKYNIEFIYEDFRKGWQYGIDKSIEKEMYRQKYCGCIYSEQERYDNKLKKRLRKLRKSQDK